MSPHHWLLRVCVLARKMLVYKIFKQQQLFLLWKESKLLLNAIRSKVSRFLSDGTGWWYRFWWKILRSALLSVPWLQPVCVAVRSCLLCVALAGHVQKRWLGTGKRKEWKREAYCRPERFHFSLYSLICAGEAPVPRRPQVPQHSSVRFLLSLQPFSSLDYVPSRLFPSVHAQAELDI